MENKKIISHMLVYLMLFALMAFSVSAAQTTVNLGTAGDFVIFSKTGITNVPPSVIVGNIGTWYSNADTNIAFAGITCPEVTGLIYSRDSTGPLSCVIADSVQVPATTVTETARSDMETAFTNAKGRTHTLIDTNTNIGSGDISGLTLTPGVTDGLYKWTTGVSINSGSPTGDPNGVTLDCQGNTRSIFIFQIAQDLTVGNDAQVTLIGGCQAKNIFWQVEGQVTLGTTSVFNGNILSQTLIAMNTDATLNGRALAQTAVTLIANTISLPADATDTIPPVITLNGINPINITQNTSYTDANATALDNMGGVVAVFSSGTVNTSIIGQYIITYNATDASENTATATRTVNVVAALDTTSPVITINGLNPVDVIQGALYTDAGATALDDVDGNITASIVVVNSVNTATLGSYTVIYNVSDAALNTATATRTVNVVAALPILAINMDMQLFMDGKNTVNGTFNGYNYSGNYSGTMNNYEPEHIGIFFFWTVNFPETNTTLDINYTDGVCTITNMTQIQNRSDWNATKTTLFLSGDEYISGTCIFDLNAGIISINTTTANITTNVDKDLDGHTEEMFGGDDCDDNNSSINPGMAEILNNDVDENCDGILGFQVPTTNPASVDLGTAGNFVILAKSGISTTGNTLITGNMGVSPIDSTAITGFGLILDSSTQFSTSASVNGNIYATDYTSPTPSMLTTAVSDMEAAYTDAAGRAADVTELGAGDIGGLTLIAGVYKWGTGLNIPTDVTLSGNSSDIWIFQVAGTLDIASSKQVILSGGAQAKNIFWQVAGVTTLGTTSVFNGNILSGPGVAVDEAIVILTDAVLNGRALSQKAVTLQSNNVSLPTAANASVLTTIIVTPTSANLTLTAYGVTQQLNAAALNQFGLPMAAIILYNSSNQSVATVNETSGFVTAVAPGSTTITATSGSKNATSVITVMTDAPILNTIGSRSVTQGMWINITLTATSPGGFNLTYNLSGKPATATFTDNHDGTAVFSWLPNVGNIGINQVTFTVTDGMKTTSEVVAITVNSFQAPTTTSTFADNTWINIEQNVTLSATGFNNTPVAYINYSLNGVPGQINGSSGNVWINLSGNNTIVFYAVDNSSNVETPKTVHIMLDKIAPNITSFTLSAIGVFTGDVITGTCAATDNLDTNLITSVTGIFTSTAGTKTATCTATDAAGNTDTETLSYIVYQRSSGGDSSSGGGSSGGGIVFDGNSSDGDNSNMPACRSESSSYSVMNRGIYNVNFSKKCTPLENIELELTGTARNVMVKVTSLLSRPSNVPAPQLKNAYEYMLVDHTNLDNSLIKSANIQFKVSKTWLISNGVKTNQIRLYRYNSGWELLETEVLTEDSMYYHFNAISPGLSYFAIGTASTAPITPPITPTPTQSTDLIVPQQTQTTAPAQSTGLSGITGAATRVINSLPSWFKISGFLLLLLLLLLVLIIAFGVNPADKKKVPAKRSPSPFGDAHPVETLEGIGPQYKKELRAIGIEDTEQLWNADAATLARKTGVSLLLVKSWQNMAELSCVKDIGPQYSELIERSGVHNIEQLKAYKPNKLLRLVREKQDSLKINIQGNIPGLSLVSNWINQARKINTSYTR